VHPILLHIGHLSLPTFGVFAVIGLMLALALSQRTALIARIAPDALWDAGLFAIVAAFVLSRLILVVTNLHTFIAYPILLLAVPSLTAMGLLFTAIATCLWLRWKRIPLLPALDAWAPCATLAWAFLALGHFFEGSDPGQPITQPVAIYAALVAGTLTAALLAATLLFAIKRPHRSGAVASLALISVGVAQFLLSFIRQPGLETIAGLDALQLVAVGMIVAGCVLWLTIKPAIRIE
jgi:phosphatidylglycerol:prolipoprotein diacylglycerol transferase